MIILDLVGQRYGRLMILKQEGVSPNGKYGRIKTWRCLCDCGNEIVIRGNDLRTGNTKSCGCLRKEVTRTLKTIHGKCGTDLYKMWSDMKKRSHGKGNKLVKRFYNGVTMCSEWEEFENFFKWAEPKWRKGLVIDRINTTGGYSPENCRFVTSKENNQNSKRSRVWVINGIKYASAQDAANHLNFSRTYIVYMCLGRVLNGKYYPPHENCYATKKYQENTICGY